MFNFRKFHGPTKREFPRNFEIRDKIFHYNFGGSVAGSYLIPDKLTDHGYPYPEGTPSSSHLHNGQLVYFLGVNRPGLGVNHPPFSSAEVEGLQSYTTATIQCLLVRMYVTGQA
jgi:hypothetical protein